MVSCGSTAGEPIPVEGNMENPDLAELPDHLDTLADALRRVADAIREIDSEPSPRPVPVPKPMPDWLTSNAFAEWLGLKPQTIRKWRVRGGGPSYVRLGYRVLYRRVDVEIWLAERTFKHTSEEKVLGATR